MNLDHHCFHKDRSYRLYNGDCIEIMRKIPDNTFDMVFADPPYGLSNGGISISNGKVVSVNKGDWDKSRGVDGDYEFHHSWIKEVNRILKPHGTLWVSGTYHSIYACGHALKKNGYKILNDIAWFKPNAPFNASCRYFTASHESLIWAAKSKESKHHFDYLKMKEGNWSEDSLKNPMKQMRSVWSIPYASMAEKKYGKHPTQKPLKLLERIIMASTKPGDLILDPFTGSSTTGVAALKHGRRFIGIDSLEEYLHLSKLRLSDVA
jgi:site-specific DNA-methyltransferase (adenine-specific)